VEEISRENLRVLLAASLEKHDLTTRRVAKAIGCSDVTVNRLRDGETLPSGEMMKQVGLMIELGFDKYARLSKAEKERLTEKASAVAGGVLGLTWISSVVSAAGGGREFRRPARHFATASWRSASPRRCWGSPARRTRSCPGAAPPRRSCPCAR
jgi:hypothetical protein